VTAIEIINRDRKECEQELGWLPKRAMIGRGYWIELFGSIPEILGWKHHDALEMDFILDEKGPDDSLSLLGDDAELIESVDLTEPEN
jgi:hypothetical protein